MLFIDELVKMGTVYWEIKASLTESRSVIGT